MGKNQHIVPVGDKWGIKGEGNSKYTSICNTQKECYDIGRKISINQKSELVVHGKNGRIREKNSYGNDSFPPRG